MLRIKAEIGYTTTPRPTYYLSTEPLDYDGKYWEPRIVNGFQIVNYFTYSDKTGNRIRSVSINLDNRDGYFDAVQVSDGFINSKFTLYFDDGLDVSKVFIGNVNSISEFGDEIRLTLMEIGYEYLKVAYPDTQIAEHYYTDEGGINASWSAIPICFGTVEDLPVRWVDTVNQRFMVCSGPIFKIKKIKFDDTVMYDSSWSDPYKGYQATPESKKIKVRIYRGIGSGTIGGSGEVKETVDGIDSSYQGYCYIEFYDDDTGNPIEPRMVDNAIPQIYVDLEGIQNSNDTGAERNPAQILYNIFNKPSSGYQGYGLGIDSSLLDFSDAITECNNQSFLMDGAITQKDTFGNWLDLLLKHCRGAISETSGKIKLTIDSSKTVSSVLFDESGETGYNCVVFPWQEPKLEAQINRLKLSYRYSYKLNRYTRVPELNEESPLGDTHLVDTVHATRVNKYNTSDIKFSMIHDDITAHKLAQYYFKNTILQLKTLKIITEINVPDNLTAGNVIKLTSSKFGWTAKEFTITEIKKSEDNFELSLQEYDSDVYVYHDITAGVDNTAIDGSKYSIPDKPTNLAVSVEKTLLNDGSNQTTIHATFTKPINNVNQVALYYKLSSETDFKFLTSTLDDKIDYIWKGAESGEYNFRVVSINSSGVYSSIDIENNDSHFYSTDSYSTEASLTITGDTIAPGLPIINDINPVIGGASISLSITGGTPSDFSHFKIWRCIDGGTFTEIEDKWSTMLFTDVDRTSIGYNTVKYRFQAFDNSGNCTSCVDSGSVTPLQVDTDDIYANAITSEKITTNQIIAKDFRTKINAGDSSGSVVKGVLFNNSGFEAWNDTARTFHIDASTGNVSMTGTITATDGCIGGFCIDETEGLYAGSGSTRVQMKAGAGFWAGATAQGDAPFSVNQAGALTAKSGEIGNWTIKSNRLCIDSKVYLGITSIGGNGLSIYGGNSAFTAIQIASECLYDSNVGGSSPRTGIVVRNASGNTLFATHSLAIDGTCQCSVIAGWDFDNTTLSSNNITINSAGSIGTNDFTTGNKGWCISCTGNAEFNNIKARGAIKTAVFEKDEISVIGGYTLIRPASNTDYYERTISSGEFSFYINDETVFNIGDIIRYKNPDDGIDYWGCVDGVGSCYIWSCYKSGSTSGTVYKGSTLVNYGSGSGSTVGGILLDGQTPYIDIYTHNGDPWNGTDSRVRLGNLNGSFGFVSDTYGIGIGCMTGHYLTYDTASNTLNMTGAINIQSGSSGIGNLTDAGNLATADNLDDVPDGSSYVRTSPNEKTGGALGYNTLTSANGLYGVGRADTRSVDSPPIDYPRGKVEEFKYSSTLGISGGDTYGNLTTNKPWGDSSGGYAVQTYEDRYGLWERRAGAGEASWGTWHKITDNTGTLVNRVIPTVNASPSGDGLYLGSDYMGFYQSSVWKTYMDNSGNFCLSGSTADYGLSWDASCDLLTVKGTVCADCGCIGCWTINSHQIRKIGTDNASMAIGGNNGEAIIWAGASSGANQITIGECIYNDNGWNPNKWGISAKFGNKTLFQVHACCDGTCQCATIAGWNFNSSKLYNDKLFIDSAGGICGNYSATTGWCIGCDGNATFNNATMRGTVCATDGCIGGWDIISGCICIGDTDNLLWLHSLCGTLLTYNFASNNRISHGQIATSNGWTNRYGLAVYQGTTRLFEASDSVCQFAGWNFNSTKLYNNCISIDSSGGICGNYTSGSTGWKIDCDGSAEFNDVTVRGTVCTNSGYIGSFCYCNYYGGAYSIINCQIIGDCCTALILQPDYYFSGRARGLLQMCYTDNNLSTNNMNFSVRLCSSTSNLDAMMKLHVCSTTHYAMYTNGHIYATAFDTPSDRNLKCDFDDYYVLPKLRELEIQAWKFKGSEQCKIGIMSQDFYDTFTGFSSNCTSVPNMDGIALKGVKELDECITCLNKCNTKLEQCITDLSTMIKIQGNQIQQIQQQIGE